MAAGYSKKPSPPSHKRRYPLDFYEFVFFIIFSMFFSLTLGLISGLWFFGDMDPNKEIVGIATMTWSLAGLLLCSAVLIMFDRAAVSRQKQKFDFDLKEYEILRKKWLELEAASMENNVLRNNNTFYITKEVPDETPVRETEVLTSITDEE